MKLVVFGPAILTSTYVFHQQTLAVLTDEVRYCFLCMYAYGSHAWYHEPVIKFCRDRLAACLPGLTCSRLTLMHCDT